MNKRNAYYVLMAGLAGHSLYTVLNADGVKADYGPIGEYCCQDNAYCHSQDQYSFCGSGDCYYSDGSPASADWGWCVIS